MERAKVIIHMYTSIDGKIDGEWDGRPGDKISGDYYDDQLFKLGSANANGSNTIVMYAAKGHPDLSKYDGQQIEYQDWVPDGIQSETWDVSYDQRGRAGWERNYFPYAGRKNRAIEVVTKQAPKSYLAFLQSMEIPYLVCGEQEIDFAESLVKLRKYFGIKTMVLGGGALINGAFLKAGLVDQISLVVAPYISGDREKKGTFDTLGSFVDQRFHIIQMKKLGDGGMHLMFDRD
ncbi:dihydrofolate reductase family protein [Limosilactobacillus fastidiosus]|uniref:Dihydrofolate reductase family protein n=1 Tax=Limosilactobacillus fastidiosus TaxID=2759855 RepID=A0A7W3TYD0_9LACO|nr:dihydrofolate reductase family protein [Limosilactobacillus fastidiosus]MBB1062556.1 dihydrofolate reductase family protein [Limosilactobacillus fastidiosus]MBB1085492.1 dihydrofolate reductase family protein [Limosilactobacillus fastidiosus]MCD7083630.1 dihydrofolate reductase family protein [Limosilactobacillus fastidiosus]MCD7085945.1 dihydrofolate reductase family protein [Limosilactobacillus fastidiosus]MCD7114411.1 dihydrofolate reductase family protein [Limosilactobacillus fastidiosu